MKTDRAVSFTLGALLADLADHLERGSVALAADEARDIVAAVLDVPRFWPTTHRDARLDPTAIEEAWRAASARVRGAPFAYAVGRAAFRYLTLAVDERVLIPRQETEVLVDLVLQAEEGGRGVVVDVGTGSGAIALALASEGAFDAVIATDVSLDAIAVAERNAAFLRDDLRVPVEFLHGSLLAPVRNRRVRAIVSNPPYIAFGEIEELPASVRDWEPPLALLSADAGLAATRAIVRDAWTVLEPRGLLAMEVDTRRASLVAEAVASHGAYRDVAVHLDLTGRERFVLARNRETSS
ncbi:MAG: protein-(glutamine-N5) methyltransferase, release factor-specific [Geminicoccaceae bacterium]|nr:protein-(glutamine-N5) methyltransferase, release factor-specific [Geminicoccaceae bacterium]